MSTYRLTAFKSGYNTHIVWKTTLCFGALYHEEQPDDQHVKSKAYYIVNTLCEFQLSA